MENAIVSNQRILIIDDNPSIFADFQKVLAPSNEISHQLKELQDIFSEDTINSSKNSPEKTIAFKLDFAQQGQAGLAQIVKAISEGQPYAVAFVDVRMPPGWDGIETISHIFEVDKEVQVVICTAYSDYSWTDIINKLGHNDRLLILKKPFDNMEVQQLANTLTHKWCLNRHIQNYINKLQRAIEASSDGIIIFSMANSSILFSNPAASRLLGVKDLENKNFLNLLSANNFDQPEYKLIEKSLKEQKNGEAIFRLQRENDIPVWCEIHVSPIPNTIDGEGQIDCFVANLIDITQNKQLSERITYQATHDVLTGLPNRTLLLDRIQQAIIQAKRYNFLVAILFLDLDRYKIVNDTFGHETGDLLLQEVANRLLHCVRESDTVSRIGGDEFVIILSSLAQERICYMIVDKILESFSQPITINNHKIISNTSIGISYYPNHATDPGVLLKKADIALYRAKEAGRGNWQLYSEKMAVAFQTKFFLENELKLALNNNQFTLVYQPLVSLQKNSVIGVEALLRWEHPTLGLILPTEFIPLAEKLGIIIPIGTWVLRTACACNKAWQNKGIPPMRMAVNVSPLQFKQKDFVSIVKNILEETELEPQYLELEITENAILLDRTEIIESMKALKQLGVSIAIDDFGTGYSNLNYLKQFPIDKIKIDKAFINDETTDAYEKSIVQAIIDIASSLELTVIGEGVETQQQFEYLKNQGSDEAQGYYISHPLSKDKIPELLEKLASGNIVELAEELK